MNGSSSSNRGSVAEMPNTELGTANSKDAVTIQECENVFTSDRPRPDAFRVLVGNPGTIPEMPWMAAGLARADLLEAYMAPLVYTEGQLARLGRLGRPGRRLRRELERRQATHGLTRETIRRRGSSLEVATVLWHRARGAGPTMRRLWTVRNDWFDLAQARALHAGLGAVVSIPGASRRTFQRAAALNVAAVLESPIAHYAYAERVLLEDALRNPGWARHLQHHDLPAPLKRHYDEEIRSADLILTLSSVHRRSFLEVGVPEDRIAVTPLGVDAKLFSPPPRPHEGDRFRVLFVGQLTQRKGLSYLLEAFVQANIRGSELVIVGSGEVPAQLRSHPRVRVEPHRPRHELPDLYHDADCFVLPSLIEGFGLTALEAMACGLPVIVSDHTFGRDLIEEGVSGFVVPVCDSEAIADRLSALASDRTLRLSVGRAARAVALRHGWATYGDSVAAILARRGGWIT